MWNRRSPNGIDSNTGLPCGAEFVLLHLNWTGFHIQSRHPCWTSQSIASFLYKQNHFCMDDLYVQCYWICQICHCFCCKCLTLGFDITARSSSLLKPCQISGEIFVGRQSQCHEIRKHPQREPREHAVFWKISLLVTLKLFYLIHTIGVCTLPALLQA